MLSIKVLRMKRKITQIQLAEMAGLNPQQISDIERGIVKDPRRKTLEKIAKALNVSVEYLYDYDRELKE